MVKNSEKNSEDYQHNSNIDSKLLEHDYDGIKELDNPVPAWISALFVITLAFAIIYGAYYFWLGIGENQEQEYISSIKKAEEKYKKAKKTTAVVGLMTDEASLTEGAKLYLEHNCGTCHGEKAEGTAIAPNLTDNSWINGCGFKNAFEIIRNGNPETGMPSLKGQLSEEKIQKLTSYILVSLKDTNPANAKEPEGEKCD